MILTSLLSTFLNKSVYAIWFINDDSMGPVQPEKILEFDSIRETGFEATSNITDYPIENGTSITDYKYDNPDTLTVVGVISRTNSSSSGLKETYWSGRDELINKARQSLDKYKRGIYRLQIQTKSGFYDWMTLQDYSIPENYDNYGLFEVEMTFKQIIRPFGVISPAKAAYSNTIEVGQVYKVEKWLNI